jgi:hypothetical protein
MQNAASDFLSQPYRNNFDIGRAVCRFDREFKRDDVTGASRNSMEQGLDLKRRLERLLDSQRFVCSLG